MHDGGWVGLWLERDGQWVHDGGGRCSWREMDNGCMIGPWLSDYNMCALFVHYSKSGVLHGSLSLKKWTMVSEWTIVAPLAGTW